TFLDNGSFFPSQSAPQAATGYSTAFGSSRIETPQVTLAASGFTSTLTGAFTANRSQSFPDVSGVVPVTGYVNSSYDSFSRANGAIGSNFNVTNGGINVASNAVQGTAAGNNVAFWSANSFFSDQFSQATVAGLNGTTDFIGPSVRVSPGSNWYSCFENSTTVFIQREVSG